MSSNALEPLLILLLSSVLGIVVAQKLRLSPILGYFLAGLAIGPYSFNLVGNTETIRLLAEIGITFLLFDVGLQFSFKTIWASRKDFLGLGPIQIISNTLIIGLVAYWILKDLTAAFVVGSALSLSSTAVTMQILQESGEQDIPLGRSALAVLIAQDIFVVFLLILLPNMGSFQGELFISLGMALLKAAMALLTVALIGRFLLRPVFKGIVATRNNDVFTASALLFVLAISWGVSQLGLSMSLGAFLAGLALAESDFQYLVKEELYPFRGLLLGLFFITVGMSLNWPLALESAGLVLLIVSGIICLKALTLWAVASLAGYRQGFAIRLGLLLSEGSEFSLVLLTIAVSATLVPAPVGQLLQLAVGLTLGLLPLLNWVGQKLSEHTEHYLVEEIPTTNNQDTQIIITGFGPIGEEVAKALETEGIPYIAFDNDRKCIARARGRGFQVHYSDTHRPKTVSETSMGKAKAVVVLLKEMKTSLALVDILKSLGPQVPIYAVASNMEHFNALSQRNLKDVLIRSPETAKVIVECLMRQLSFSEEKIVERLEWMNRQESLPFVLT